jgi:hypothetical protein
MKFRRTLIALLPLCGATGSFAAEVTADFNDMNPGAMRVGDGQPANTGTGFLDAYWDANTGVQVVAAGDLTSAVPGYAVAQGGAAQKFGPAATIAANLRQQARTVQTLAGSSIWFSYLMSKPTAAGRAGLGFNQGAFEIPGDPRLVWVNDTVDFRAANVVVGTTPLLSTASTVLVIGRIQPNAGAGGEDHISIWVNPADVSSFASMGAPSISVTTSNWISGDTIRDIHPQCYGASGASAPYLDSIRLSNEGDAFFFVTGRTADPTLGIDATGPAPDFAFGNRFATAPLVATRTVRLKNEGTTQDISIQGLNVSNDGGGTFQIVSPPATPFTLLPGQTFDVTVQATTSTSGTVINGALAIDTDEDSATNLQDRTLPLSVRLFTSGQIANANPSHDADLTGWNNSTGGTQVFPGILGPQGSAMRVKGKGDVLAGEPDHFGQILPTGGADWELVYWVTPMAKSELERYTGFPPDGDFLDRSLQTIIMGNNVPFPGNGGVWTDADAANALVNLAYFPDGIVNGGAEGFYVYDGVSGWVHQPGLGTIAGSVDVDANGIPFDGTGDKGDGILNSAAGDTVNAYQIRIKGHGFGSPGATFDISVSQPNTVTVAGSVTGLTYYDDLNITASTPSALVHTTGDTSSGSGIITGGATTSFWTDDTYYFAIGAPSRGIEILAGTPQILTHETTTGTANFSLRNYGLSSNLNVSSIVPGNPAFTVTNPATPFAVAPGGVEVVTVQFDSSVLGSATAALTQLTVNSDDTNHPATTLNVLGGKSSATNLLPNWDFEVAGAAPATDAFTWWQELGTPANVKKVPGLLAGSPSAAWLSSANGFGRAVHDLSVPAAAASVEAVFAVKSTATRAFNVLLQDDDDASGGQINLRYEAGVWSVFGGTPAVWNPVIDLTGAPLTASVDANGNGNLNDVGDTKVPYRLKIISTGWGTGLSYSIEVMDAAGTVLGSASGLNITQNAVPNSPLGRIEFSTEFGTSPGFWVDDVLVSTVTVSPGVTVTSFVKSGGSATITWDSGGAPVTVQRSTDLLDWTTVLSTGNTSGTYTDGGAPEGRAFYRVISE